MDKKIRVALITSTIDGRRAMGTAVVARKWIEALLAHRDEFDLTFLHYETSDDPIYQEGVREIIFPQLRPRVLNRRMLRFIYYVFTTKDRFDIMQWFQPRLYPFFWRAPADHIVVAVHGAGDVSPYKRFNLMRLVFNQTLIFWRSRVSAAIAGSAYAGDDIVKGYGFQREQVHVINNGVEAEFKPAAEAEVVRIREKYNLPQTFFLGVGRLIPIKNVLRCLEAFELYCEERKSDTMHYVHVGGSGTEQSVIDQFVERSPYKDRIHFVRYVEQDDLPAMYSTAFMLVFPLLTEGFGLPAIEAMACGTPTIIANTAAPEITSEDAVLVDALSAEDIARGMRQVVSDDSLRDRLRTRGLLLAKKYTWEESGKKLIELYRHILAH
jgi:glycosyltransferase involved in cell wall biosynthesis